MEVGFEGCLDMLMLCACFPVGVTYLSRPDTCLGIGIHLSICGGMEHFTFGLMYV